jgi:hypothetical protein
MEEPDDRKQYNFLFLIDDTVMPSDVASNASNENSDCGESSQCSLGADTKTRRARHGTTTGSPHGSLETIATAATQGSFNPAGGAEQYSHHSSGCISTTSGLEGASDDENTSEDCRGIAYAAC